MTTDGGCTPLDHAHAELEGVRLHYVSAGAGEPVVLLHGWPQSWFEWRLVIPLLSPHYRVIAPDLRGLGDSSRPAAGYDTDTLAADIWRLMTEHLQLPHFIAVGHDWGGPVAFSLAAAHRQAVRGLAVIDVAIPGDGAADISQGGRRWHHAFHRTADLPEALIAGREALYLGWFFSNYGASPDAVSGEAVAEYLRTYREPAALRAGFEYYRNLPRDIEQNTLALRAGKLPMPVLALGGTDGWGRGTEVLESCRRVADNVTGGVIDGAGHWIPEEQPQALADALLEFFARCA